MEFVLLHINLIKPSKNLKRDNRNKYYLIESIKDYGFINPILIDKNNYIISGNSRYEAAKELGIQVIPCIMINELNDKQIKEYKVLDNHIQELSNWNYHEKKKYILDNHLALAKYDLPEDYDININIDDFFEEEKVKKLSIFDFGDDE